MPIQVFADESGSRGATDVIVMVGLIAEAQDWVEFANDWASEPNEHPVV